MFWKKLGYYLNPFSKRDELAKSQLSLRAMHGVNRISIYVFLIALVVLAIRFFSE